MATQDRRCLTQSDEMSAGERDDKRLLVRGAIEDLISEGRVEYDPRTGEADEPLLLSRLLSQMESSKEESEEITSSSSAEERGKGASTPQELPKMTAEEIVRELREVKRQNTITHWLLTALIVITAAWQLSEVSLILSVKNKVTNPLRTVRSIFAGFLKVGSRQRDDGDSSTSGGTPRELPQLPSLQMPVIIQREGQNLAMKSRE